MPIINMVYKKKKWWKPWANTLLYLPLESNITDQSWNSRSTSATNVSFTTVWWLASASIPSNWYITIPNDIVSYSISERTVSCLIYVTSLQVSQRRSILRMLKNWVSYNNILILENTTNIYDNIATSSTTLSQAYWTWYLVNSRNNIVATCNSSWHNLYINWTKIATATWFDKPRWVKYNSINDAMKIWGSDSWQWLNGNMREMIMEDVMWSDDDVSNYYNRIKSKLWL